MSSRQVSLRDHGLGALLMVLYVAILAATSADLGMSRDESVYAAASESYARWLGIFLDDPSSAVDRRSIDRYWKTNHEHPGLPKTVFALFHLVQQRWALFESDSLAHRFGGMLSAGLLLWLVYIFGLRLFGRRAGLFAALALASLPRLFYHSHLNAFDVPITLAVTAVTYAYWRSLADRRWALWTGLLFGLALATAQG